MLVRTLRNGPPALFPEKGEFNTVRGEAGRSPIGSDWPREPGGSAVAGRVAEALGRRRGGILVVLTGLVLVAGSVAGLGASAAPGNNGNAIGNSANQACGAYCPTGVGLPSGNGNGNGDAIGK